MPNLENVLLRGDRASQPLATDVSEGSIYFVTDEFVTEQSRGGVWVDYSVGGGSDITQLTGDVTAGPGGGSVASTISNDAITTPKIINSAVTNAKLADMAMSTVKGRVTAGTGPVEDLTGAEVTTLLSPFVGDTGSGGVKGLVPAPVSGDAAKFLKGNGTWGAAGAGSGDVIGPEGVSADGNIVLYDGLTGKLIKDSGLTLAQAGESFAPVGATFLTEDDETPDLPNSRQLVAGANINLDDSTPGQLEISAASGGGITELTGNVTAGPGSGSQAATIANAAVTYAKIQNVTESRILGRGQGSGAGSPQELSLGSGLDLTGTTISALASSTDLRTARLSLTDAQIKSLNSSPVQIVAAPVSGLIIVPLAMTGFKNSAGGAYSGGPTLNLRWSGDTTDLIQGGLGLFFNAASLRWGRACAVGDTVGLNSPPTGVSLLLRSSADVTGGNAANFCIIEVIYVILDTVP